MRDRDKDFLLSQPFLGYELPHDCVTTGVLMLVAQTLKYALCRVPLLLEDVPVVLQDLMNDADKGTQFGCYRAVFTLVARRYCVIDHLVDGLAADAEIPCCGAFAHGIDHDCAPDFGV